MIITVRGHPDPLHLMNMYSDEDGSAIWYIEDHLEVFPDLGYMGGDFNCPSSHWDATILCKQGWVTHLSYNAVLHGSILDLVFLLIYQGYTANLIIGDKGELNHY
jgi:hypothetical protein